MPPSPPPHTPFWGPQNCLRRESLLRVTYVLVLNSYPDRPLSEILYPPLCSCNYITERGTHIQAIYNRVTPPPPTPRKVIPHNLPTPGSIPDRQIKMDNSTAAIYRPFPFPSQSKLIRFESASSHTFPSLPFILPYSSRKSLLHVGIRFQPPSGGTNHRTVSSIVSYTYVTIPG